MHATSHHRYPGARRERGLTMIELMISITIGLFLVGAIGYLYISSRGAYRSNAALSRVQEDGRFGLDALMHDARAVGDLGCNAAANVHDAAAAPLALPGDAGAQLQFAGAATALYGVDASSYQFSPAPTTTFVPPAAPPWIAGDVLQMVIPTSKPVSLTADVAGPSVALADNSARLRANDYLLIANCVNAGIARVATTPTTTGAVTVALDGTPLLSTAVPQLTLATHSSAQRVDAVTYYVGQFPGRRWPALYRYSATYGVAEEVVDHVENMSVLYGVGSNPPVRAGGVPGAGGWDKVTSVRVSLQVVGDEQSTATPGAAITLLPGGAAAAVAPDTRLRQVFTETAALRNRLP